MTLLLDTMKRTMHMLMHTSAKRENDLYVTGTCTSEANKPERLTLDHTPRTAQSNAMQSNDKQSEAEQRSATNTKAKQNEEMQGEATLAAPLFPRDKAKTNTNSHQAKRKHLIGVAPVSSHM